MTKDRQNLALFEQTVLPHLDAAYNLARWIMGNDQDAEDMAQEAILRAYQYFGGYQGGSSRSWVLTIVRNTCYTWLRQHRSESLSVELGDELSAGETVGASPEASLLFQLDRQVIRTALEKLPVEYRELIILRELEGLSYKEIAVVASLPMGTVMSRLARARSQLKNCLLAQLGKGGHNGL